MPEGEPPAPKTEAQLKEEAEWAKADAYLDSREKSRALGRQLLQAARSRRVVVDVLGVKVDVPHPGTDRLIEAAQALSVLGSGLKADFGNDPTKAVSEIKRMLLEALRTACDLSDGALEYDQLSKDRRGLDVAIAFLNGLPAAVQGEQKAVATFRR